MSYIMCTRNPDLVSLDFYAIPIYEFTCICKLESVWKTLAHEQCMAGAHVQGGLEGD